MDANRHLVPQSAAASSWSLPKKIIAVATALALVLGLSSLQVLTGTDRAVAGVPRAVNVEFHVGPGVSIMVEGETLTTDADRQGVLSTVHSTNADGVFEALSFTATATAEQGQLKKISGAKLGFAHDDQAPAPNASGQPTASPSNAGPAPSEGDEFSEVKVDPSTEGENPSATDDSSNATSADNDGASPAPAENGQSPDIDNMPRGDELTDEELQAREAEVHGIQTQAEGQVIADDQTPQAPEPGDAAQLKPETSDEYELTAGEDGNYEIKSQDFDRAADMKEKIIVTVEAEDLDKISEVGTFAALQEALEKPQDEVEGVVLTGPITIEADNLRTINVNGTKHLELAGNAITYSGEENPGYTIFTVEKGAKLVVSDAKSTVRPQRVGGFEAMPSPQEDPSAFQAALAKGASYENQKLTYYLTHSQANRVEGTTSERTAKYELDLSGALGKIQAENVESLVSVQGGILEISGGLFTGVNVAHAVEVSNGMLTMSGGYLVGSQSSANASEQGAQVTNQTTAGKGAGIFATGSSSKVSLGLNAVVAANTAENCGGGIYVAGIEKVNVDGNALIVGNQAGTKDGSGDGTDMDLQPYKKHAQKYNGGGLYAEASNGQAPEVEIKGAAVIAGNIAGCDGGGIYVAPVSNGADKPQVAIGGDALISHNASYNNRSFWHTGNLQEASAKLPSGAALWHALTGGGGGVFSMGDTTISGAVFTANFAQDAGGAIYVSGETFAGYASPKLTVSHTVIASNMAHDSEGGGLWCQPKAGSEIKSGYITNNATMTAFDFGGGALYVNSGGTLQVSDPLVSANEAEAFGGGVASCTNGTVLTSDAAVFDNQANRKADHVTVNPSEHADEWARDVIPADDESASSAAADFFGAQNCTVYNQMLHEPEDGKEIHGEYHWSGYLSGPNVQSKDYAKSSEVTIEQYKKPTSNGAGFLKTPKGRDAQPFKYIHSMAYADTRDGKRVYELYLTAGSYSKATECTSEDAAAIKKFFNNNHPSMTFYGNTTEGIEDAQSLFQGRVSEDVTYQRVSQGGRSYYKFTVPVSPEITIQSFVPSTRSYSKPQPAYAGFVGLRQLFTGTWFVRPFAIDFNGINSLVQDRPLSSNKGDKVVTLYIQKRSSRSGLGLDDSSAKKLLAYLQEGAPGTIHVGVTEDINDALASYRGLVSTDQTMLESEKKTVKDEAGKEVTADCYKYTLTVSAEGGQAFKTTNVNGKDRDLRVENFNDKLAAVGTLVDTAVDTSKKAAGLFSIYRFEKDSLTEMTDFVVADRFIALTADPTDEDKASAKRAARVFVTGNYSNTNGGGITCNGAIVVGHEPGTTTEYPDAGLGRLKLTKEATNVPDGAKEPFSAVFTVKGYENERDAGDEDMLIYDNVVGFSFEADGTSEPVVLDNLKPGYYLVEEVGYSGDNAYDRRTNANKFSFTVPDEKNGADYSFDKAISFKNVYVDEGGRGDGAVNRYEKADGQDGSVLRWTEAKPVGKGA